MSQPPVPTAAWPPPAHPVAWQQPLPRPPKPERPLRPAIVWSAVINLIWALGWVATMLVIGAVIVGLVDVASAGEADLALSDGQTAGIVWLLVGGFALTALVGTGVTIGALMLLRLGASYRTFPSFVQALLASICAFVVSSIVGTAVGLVGELASSAPAVFGQ